MTDDVKCESNGMSKTVNVGAIESGAVSWMKKFGGVVQK